MKLGHAEGTGPTYGAGGERARLQTSQLPLYVTLARLMSSEIETGRWRAGQQLPTIASLSDTYGVARVTIRQALGILSGDGLIRTIQGKGSFVNDRAPSRLIELESSWDDLLRTLDGNVAEILEVMEDVDLPGSFSRGADGGSYRYMRRIHRRRDEPYCIMEMYLASEYYERAPDRFDVEMVIPILSRMAGAALKRMTQSLRIGTASLSTAKLLEIPPGAPVGDVTRVITSIDDQILYLGVASYRGDLVVFNTSLDVRMSK